MQGVANFIQQINKTKKQENNTKSFYLNIFHLKISTLNSRLFKIFFFIFQNDTK